jgi:hypothetical protein
MVREIRSWQYAMAMDLMLEIKIDVQYVGIILDFGLFERKRYQCV